MSGQTAGPFPDKRARIVQFPHSIWRSGGDFGQGRLLESMLTERVIVDVPLVAKDPPAVIAAVLNLDTRCRLMLWMNLFYVAGAIDCTVEKFLAHCALVHAASLGLL